jgi:hypothetical protein
MVNKKCRTNEKKYPYKEEFDVAFGYSEIKLQCIKGVSISFLFCIFVILERERH